MLEEKDKHKQKEMSEKIFKTMDASHNRSLDKKEMLSLVEAFFKSDSDEMKNIMKEMGANEKVVKNRWKKLFSTL